MAKIAATAPALSASKSSKAPLRVSVVFCNTSMRPPYAMAMATGATTRAQVAVVPVPRTAVADHRSSVAMIP